MDLVKLKEEARDQKISSPNDLKNIKTQKELEDDFEYAKRIENFKVTYTDDAKGDMESVVTSRIMNHEERIRYDRVISDLSGGVPFDTLPVDTRNRYICVARMVCQIVDPVEWLLEKAGEDLEFCFSIGGKLLDHESRFFRNSSRTNKKAEGKPRFSID
tara:strand:+ start:77 stop:553 length:477 start_codon:yes stop_codon:yes gene_type:complete